jgi:hypothetical protein
MVHCPDVCTEAIGERPNEERRRTKCGMKKGANPTTSPEVADLNAVKREKCHTFVHTYLKRTAEQQGTVVL